jgi:hypothetical protein
MAISRPEREDLQRLVRQREKVLKSAAKQRSAELLADFDNQLASEFSFDDDGVWEAAKRAADIEIDKARVIIAKRCRELGIPERFAPSVSMHWHVRGYDNSVKARREELRRVAITRIEAIEREAVVKIQIASVEAQTQLALAGLTSDAARTFLNALPSIESLMPPLSFEAIAGPPDEPSVVEQLVTPNALRQRRRRERLKALRGSVTGVTDGVTGVTERDGGDGTP